MASQPEKNFVTAEGKALGALTDERASGSADTEAQRRQLTTMFCDLAGSTELSRRYDPEA